MMFAKKGFWSTEDSTRFDNERDVCKIGATNVALDRDGDGLPGYGKLSVQEQQGLTPAPLLSSRQRPLYAKKVVLSMNFHRYNPDR